MALTAGSPSMSGKPPPSLKAFRHQSGFNLLELLVVLVIAGVLFGVALPAGQSLIEQGQLRGATNEVYATLSFTRNEATRRRQDFSLCAVSSAESTSCSGSSQPFLAVFVAEGSSLATGRTNPIELTSPARVSLNNTPGNRLIFERLGNRTAADNSNEPVSLVVTVNSRTRTIDVCFNGRIVIREEGSNQNGCDL